LTGRPAPDLFADGKINWAWRNWVHVSDGLANVLGKMLAPEPTDRYQSAVEVFQALQSLSVPQDRPEQTKPLAMSQLRSPEEMEDPSANRATTAARRVYNAVTNFDVKSIWENPLVFIPLFLVVGATSFLGGLIAMNLFSKPSTVASPSPSATASEQPLVSSSTAGDAKTTKTLDLIVDQITFQSNRLEANKEDTYEFYGTQGREVALAILDNKNLLLTVLAPNGSPVDAQAIRTPSWRGVLPALGKYTVQVKPLPGAKDAFFDYRISATLAAVVSTPRPVDSGSSQSTATPTVSAPNPANDFRGIAPSGATPRPVPIDIPSSQPRTSVSPSSVEQESGGEPETNASPTPSFMEPSPESSPSSSATPTPSVSASSTPAETLPPP
jgi:hypothetical protein